MQLFIYMLVQLVAYGMDMAGFVLLFHLGADPRVATLVSKIIAGVFTFFVHRNFTFGGGGTLATGKQAMRYFPLLALNTGFSALVLSALLWVVPIVVAAKFLADAICVLLSYWLSKRFIFLADGISSADIASERGKI